MMFTEPNRLSPSRFAQPQCPLSAPRKVADLEESNRMIHRRDQLLEATARATNVLLTGENFDAAVNTALGIFLEAADCDRIKVFENSFNASSIWSLYCTATYECVGSGIAKLTSQLEFGRISSEGVAEAFIERF